MVAAASGNGSALSRMGAVVDAYFRVLGEHPALPRLMLQELAAGRRPPETVVRIFRAIATRIAALQEEGERDGSVRAGDPILTAFSLVAQPIYMTLVTPMVKEVLGLSFAEPDFRERMIRHATDFARAGVAAQPIREAE